MREAKWFVCEQKVDFKYTWEDIPLVKKLSRVVILNREG